MPSAFASAFQDEGPPKKRSVFADSFSEDDATTKRSAFAESFTSGATTPAEDAEEGPRDPRRLLAHATNAAMPRSVAHPIRGAVTDIDQSLLENIAVVPPGQITAANRLAGGNIGKTIKFMYPEIGGRNPTLEEIRAASKDDDNLAVVLSFVEKMQRESKALQDEQEKAAGGPIDFDQANFAALEQSRAERKKAGDKTVQLGNAQQLIEEYDKLDKIPGVNVAAMTDQDVANYTTEIIRAAESGDMSKLPKWAQVVSSGLASGVHIALTTPIAKGAMALGGTSAKAAAIAGAAQFGALSAGTQALAVASGAQPEFSIEEMGKEAAVGGIAGFAAAKMAERTLDRGVKSILGMDQKLRKPGDIAAVQKKAALVGNATAIGSMELSQAGFDAVRDSKEAHGEGDGFWMSAFYKALGLTSTLFSAHTLGGAIPGRARAVQDAEAAGLHAATKPLVPSEELSRLWNAQASGVKDSKTSYLAEQRAFDDIAADAIGRTVNGLAEKAFSLNGRIPALGEFARRALDDTPKMTKKIIEDRRNEMALLSMEFDREARKASEYLDRMAGGNQEIKDKLWHTLWIDLEGKSADQVKYYDRVLKRVVNRRAGAPPERDITSQFRSMFSPEVLAEGSVRAEKLKQAMLKFGVKGEDYGFWPTAIYKDSAGVETIVTKADIREGRVSPEMMARGDYGELVGGIEKFRQEGGYFPHISEYATSLLRKPWKIRFGKEGVTGPATIAGYLQDEYVRQRTMRRELSTADFIQALVNAKDPKKIDTSYEAIVETAARESSAIATKAALEDFRSAGILRRGDMMPQDVEMETKRAQIVEIQNKTGELRDELKKLRGGDKSKGALAVAERREKARELYWQINTLKEHERALTQEISGGWKKLEGKEWGQYDSNTKDKDGNPGPTWHLRIDAFDAVKPLMRGDNHWLDLGRSLHRLSKSVKTGFSPARRFLEDEMGNVLAYTDAGLYNPRTDAYAKGKLIDFRFNGKVDDPRLEMFLALSKGHFIGSSGEVQKFDNAEYNRVKRLASESLHKGEVGPTIANGLNTAVTFVEKLYGEAPVLGTASKFYKTVVDEAHAYSGFLEALKQGKTPQEAWEAVAPIADMSSLPIGLKRAAMGMSYIRYPAQMGRLYAKHVAKRPATFFGIDLGRMLGLDSAIRSGSGDAKAQVALLTRSLLNLVAKGAQMVIPVQAATSVILAEQGTSREEWESYLDQEYKEHSDTVGGLMKLLSLPMPKTELGRLSHLNLSRIVPWMAPLTFFAAHPQGGRLLDLVNKNTLVSPWAQGAMNRDFRGTTPPQGHLPGERWWPAWSQFVPGLLTSIAQEVTRNESLPDKDRSKLRSIARLVGVPLREGEAANPLKQAIEIFRDMGVVQMVEGEDGREHYGITNYLNPLSAPADGLIQQYYSLPISEFQVHRKAMNKAGALEDAMQIR